jgi:hypothetical protein
MRAGGYGRIVNVSIGDGSFAETGDASAPAYSVSRAGLNMLALELDGQTSLSMPRRMRGSHVHDPYDYRNLSGLGTFTTKPCLLFCHLRPTHPR